MRKSQRDPIHHNFPAYLSLRFANGLPHTQFKRCHPERSEALKALCGVMD